MFLIFDKIEKRLLVSNQKVGKVLDHIRVFFSPQLGFPPPQKKNPIFQDVGKFFTRIFF